MKRCMASIRPSQFQRSVKYIIPKRILGVCLHINVTIMHIWGVDGGGVFRPLPLHIVASLSRLLSPSSLLKAAHVLPVQNVHIFLPIFLSSLAHFLPAPHHPLCPCQAFLFSTDHRKIINYVFHIAYMTSHICWYTFLSSYFGINWSPTCLNFGNYIFTHKTTSFHMLCLHSFW